MNMGKEKHGIAKWAEDDQPREKLLRKNPQSLSNSELLAILINKGTAQHSAVELAKDILKMAKDDLLELGKLAVPDLMSFKGIGLAKASAIVAAMELGRRRQAAPLLKKPLVKDSRSVAAYLQSLLKDYHHEVFGVLYLNRAGRIKNFGIISQGGITGTIADPRLVFKKALEEEAVSIIIYHNHPSGSLRPSKADEELTLKIREGAKYLDIKLLDHIIVSDEGYFSFADEGRL
jgi:DNA repair protein RadC